MLLDDSKPWSIQQLFRFLDHNKDGVIDAQDLVAVCTQPDPDSHIDQVVLLGLKNKMATDANVSTLRLSYSEFATLVDRHELPVNNITSEHLGKILDVVVAHTLTPSSSTNPTSLQYWKEALTSDTSKHLIAGGMAGAVSRTVVSPVERMKILFQVQGPGPGAYEGVFPTLARMWREEGLMGFMRGNGTNVIRIVPYSASQFAAYEQCKTLLMEPGKTELDTPRRLVAGAVAGVVSVACTYPLDIVRTRLSVQSAMMQNSIRNNTINPGEKLPGIWTTMKTIYKTEGGLFGLYRGLWPTTLGVAPYVSVSFTSYEGLKPYLVTKDGQEPSAVGRLVCGALAGTIAQTITYPLDVLRRRMQMTGMASVNYKYKGTWDATRTIIRQEGIRGMYRGMIPNYLKVAPAIGVSFVTYEWCKDLLNAD